MDAAFVVSDFRFFPAVSSDVEFAGDLMGFEKNWTAVLRIWMPIEPEPIPIAEI